MASIMRRSTGNFGSNCSFGSFNFGSESGLEDLSNFTQLSQGQGDFATAMDTLDFTSCGPMIGRGSFMPFGKELSSSKKEGWSNFAQVASYGEKSCSVPSVDKPSIVPTAKEESLTPFTMHIDSAEVHAASEEDDHQGKGKEQPEEEDEELDQDEVDLNFKRARNRMHALKSRNRKRQMMEVLEQKLLSLRSENMNLRKMVQSALPEKAESILKACSSTKEDRGDATGAEEDANGLRRGKRRGRPTAAASASKSLVSIPKGVPNAIQLMEQDYSLIQSLQNGQQNFVLTDPSLHDNPIVYSSQGFLKMSGYSAEQMLGRNMRVMQGPGTDPVCVDIIRRNLAEGRDSSVCLINYTAQGRPFWNQLYVGALRDRDGRIVYYVGVQCEVPSVNATEFHRRLHAVHLPEVLMQAEGAGISQPVRAGKRGRSNSKTT